MKKHKMGQSYPTPFAIPFVKSLFTNWKYSMYSNVENCWKLYCF